MVKKHENTTKNIKQKNRKTSEKDNLKESQKALKIQNDVDFILPISDKIILVRRDLLLYEHIICQDFSDFLHFEGHALYFPIQDELQNFQYIENEKKILIPLRHENALLGILLLRNVSIKNTEDENSSQSMLFTFLPQIAKMCLDKIYFIKLSTLDETYKLIRPKYFMERMGKDVCAIKKIHSKSLTESFAKNSMQNLDEDVFEIFEESSLNSPDYKGKKTGKNQASKKSHKTSDKVKSNSEEALNKTKNTIEKSLDNFNIFFENTIDTNALVQEKQSSLGIMVLPILGLDYIRKFYGFRIAQEITCSLAQKIKSSLPEEGLCTKLDDDSFAVMYSGATRPLMENLAKHCAQLEANMRAIPLQSMFATLEHYQNEHFFGENTVNEKAIAQSIREDFLSNDEHFSQISSEFQKELKTKDSTSESAPKGILVEAKLCAAYALFPQDWDGTNHSTDSEEIPYLLLNKAQIAATRLKNTPQKKGLAPEKKALHIAGLSLSYKDILLQGGAIEALMPYSQVRINLGSEDGALENMCFSVWSDNKHTQYKGEILLRRVREKNAEAEILMLSDPAKNLEEGDILQYIPQSHSKSESFQKSKDSDLESGCNSGIFYAYRDFMHIVNNSISVQNIKNFSISLIRIQWEKMPENYAQSFEDSTNTSSNDKSVFTMKDIAREVDRYITAYNTKNAHTMATDIDAEKTAEKTISAPIIGSMSFNSVLIFHPHMNEENAHILYTKIAQMIRKVFGVPCAIGIFIYPFLSLRPAEMWDCCKKALDYAMLLPSPHVGIFDTLAMNISADRKFSQGDLFGAVEEYRMALLADGDNVLAWNSLGVCLSKLGRHAEARNAFEVAYARNTKDFTTSYNLGMANLSLGDKEKAKEYFLVCLRYEKKHLFARIRLGEIAESQIYSNITFEDENKQDENSFNDIAFNDALEQYLLAKTANPESSVPFRCLARLYMQKNETERAREFLQIALQKNADDAISLQLLAGLYLDGGEDAHLAELLARQSVALLPWRRSAWSELARALEAQGRFSEAATVRQNSMRL